MTELPDVVPILVFTATTSHTIVREALTFFQKQRGAHTCPYDFGNARASKHRTAVFVSHDEMLTDMIAVWGTREKLVAAGHDLTHAHEADTCIIIRGRSTFNGTQASLLDWLVVLLPELARAYDDLIHLPLPKESLSPSVTRLCEPAERNVAIRRGGW